MSITYTMKQKNIKECVCGQCWSNDMCLRMLPEKRLLITILIANVISMAHCLAKLIISGRFEHLICNELFSICVAKRKTLLRIRIKCLGKNLTLEFKVNSIIHPPIEY